MLPCAISASIVNVKPFLPLGTYFESRLEVTDSSAAVCSASTRSFYVVYDFIYRLSNRVSNLDFDSVTSLSSPQKTFTIICALINGLSIPRTFTNRRCDSLSGRHYELLKDENQHALAPLALQLR